MRPLSRIGNYISTRIGRAIEDYKLIEDKDRILVAVSGGKDSLTMLKLLVERKRWAPVSYELIAMHVTSDYNKSAHTKKRLRKFFKENRVKYYFKDIKITDRERGVNCFWCSWNRRKALFLAADRLKCNKVALGHHKDDIVETLLLNMLYHGEFSAMNPRQELFGGRLVIIRPLCYVEEDRIRKFAGESGFPAAGCRCPNSEISKRRKMKDFIRKMEKDCKHVKTNIFRSISRVKEEYIKIR
ncbi:MAG: ATP-binding protein [Candidatus Omnitrophota bacterium]